MTFKLNDRVRWSTQGRGRVTERLGFVAEVVPAGKRPRRNLQDPGQPRDHESYVVQVLTPGGYQYFWPHVVKLEPAEVSRG